jgi:hypothetical protein
MVRDWCGEYSKSKHLPDWISDLSHGQANYLLDVMVSGDGTHRPRSDIYYTASKTLSEDTQRLALIAGKVSKKWEYIGKHVCDQIYLSGKPIVDTFNTRSHLRVSPVVGDHIVCFTVPNENLITRRNGKIAIQGNTKHAMHLIRLLRMGEEILTTGKVKVKREDAQELLDIRNGALSYEELVSWAEAQDNKIRGELYKNSCLPKKPDVKLAASVLMDVQDMYW